MLSGRVIEAMGDDVAVVRRLDQEVQARWFVDALALAEALLHPPRPLATAPW